MIFLEMKNPKIFIQYCIQVRTNNKELRKIFAQIQS